MIPVSIVIITKNKADTIALSMAKARRITDDIVVIYSHDKDDNARTTINYSCRIFKKSWDGYGANKNKGIRIAKYDWILSIDADEVPDEELITALHQLKFDDPALVYDIKFKSHFGGKEIRFGSWGRDHHIRIFNRRLIKWDEAIVHETLVRPLNTQVRRIGGSLHHYSVKDADDYEQKNSRYAALSAKKYFDRGKSASIIKLYFSPIFGFVRNYIFLLGFLDGREGWVIAKITYKNTWLKYRLLRHLEAMDGNRKVAEKEFVVEYEY